MHRWVLPNPFSANINIQSESFSSVLRVIQALGAERQAFGKDGPTEDGSFPNDILMTLTKFIMESIVGPESAAVDFLYKKAMNKYLDVKYYSYRNFQ